MSPHKPWKLHGVVAVVLAATLVQVLLFTPVVHAADGGGLRRSVEEATDGRIDPSHRDLGNRKAKRKNPRAQHEKSELRRGVGKNKGNSGRNIKPASDAFVIKGDKIIVLSGDDGDEGEPVGDKKPGKLRPNSGGVKPNAANSHQSQDPNDWNDMGYQSGKNMIPNSAGGGSYYINDKTDTIYVTKGSGGNGKKPGKKKPHKKQMNGGGSKNNKPTKAGGIKPGKDKPSSGSGLNEFGFVSGSQEKPASEALNSKGDIIIKRGKKGI